MRQKNEWVEDSWVEITATNKNKEKRLKRTEDTSGSALNVPTLGL